ncbi:unnamed protein product [Bemisia tabaci]|uniref:Uncharacterized protein n=1 Tax=Bemisia tabaci TaxID=7038 RepID=A0A9P0A3A7_BEMTA|nr:unnamed protein product [Bemisia tabaci]
MAGKLLDSLRHLGDTRRARKPCDDSHLQYIGAKLSSLGTSTGHLDQSESTRNLLGARLGLAESVTVNEVKSNNNNNNNNNDDCPCADGKSDVSDSVNNNLGDNSVKCGKHSDSTRSLDNSNSGAAKPPGKRPPGPGRSCCAREKVDNDFFPTFGNSGKTPCTCALQGCCI